MAIRGITRDFYTKFTFTVEIAGVTWAGFQTCSEIRIQTAKIEHWEGGVLIPDKSPGRVTVPDVTLTRGATQDVDFYEWVGEVVEAGSVLTGAEFKRSVDIVQKDRRGVELRRWTLVNA